MRKTILSLMILTAMSSVQILSAQTNVTSLRVINPDFEARFAGWENNGFFFVTNNSFAGKHGCIYMERWVPSGDIVPDVELYQNLTGLPPGTYTLVADCQNVQQANPSQVCKGASLFAGDESVEVSKCDKYSVTFTVLDGKAKIGIRTMESNGNWVSIDNILLFYNAASLDSLHVELQKVIDQGEAAINGGEGVEKLQAAIDNAKLMLTSDVRKDISDAAKQLNDAVIVYRMQNATGPIPEIMDRNYLAVGATIALGRLNYRSNGASVTERGFCWNTTGEPTILDDRTSECFYNRGEVFHIDRLTPATEYFVRPYLITRGNQVAYGSTVKIATLPMGNLQYNYDNGGNTEEAYRIKSALEETKWLYNNLTNVRGITLDVHYSPGTPTADCSYGGYMRVGSNAAYQNTGTILHEVSHGVGVGTSNEWWSNLFREEGDRGRWLGPRTTEMIRFFNNDVTAFITGDNMHMWPISAYECPHFGINGAFEDTTNPENTLLYYGNVMLVHAMHQDGLICSPAVGGASPAYVMQQDDNKKYYIKNEDSRYGNADSYVGVANDALVNAKASMKNSVLDDSYAWHIKYNPATCMYSFQNAATGKYIANIDGNFKLSDTSAGIQLLPSRYIYEHGGISAATYWMINESRAMQGSDLIVSTSGFNKSNNASRQRWLLLTADEAENHDINCSAAAVRDLDKLISQVRASAATEHVAKEANQSVEEIDNAFDNTIQSIEEEKSRYTVAEAYEAETSIVNAFIEFITAVNPKLITSPFDLTWMLKNPDFEVNGDSWNIAVAQGYGCGEFYEKRFNLYQTIPSVLPAGTYRATVQGFQRPGSAGDTKNEYDSGINNVKCSLIMTGASNVNIKNIWDDAQPTKIGRGKALRIGGLYIPDSMEAADSWFKAGFYNNEILSTLSEESAISIGMRSSKSDTQWWTIFDNFKLYYYGTYSQEDILTGINEVREEKPVSREQMYNIQGVRVNDSYKGIIIKDGKKFVK
jgi:hypothetical protein